MANDKNFKIKNGLSAAQYLQTTGTSSSQAEPNYIGNPSYDSKSFSASGQTSAIQGITFKTDGTVMYLLSSSDDRVYQYTLSTAWDVSTASYASILYNIPSLPSAAVPTAIEFKPDGTKMFISTNQGTIYAYDLSTAWNVSTASSDTNLSPSEVSNIAGFAFKSDGTKLYIQIEAVFYQYTVGTAWNISTASYDSVTKDFRSTQDTVITDLILSSDGFSMSSASNGLESIEQFKMSTAYDLSTAFYEGSYPIAETNGVTSVTFGSSGTKMYVVATSETIYQYTVGTTFETLDLSTGSYLSKTLSTDTTFAISNPPASGTAMGFVLSVTGGANGFDLAGASYDSSFFSVSSQDANTRSMAVNNDGTKLYMCGTSTDNIYEYDLSTAFDLSTASYNSVSFYLGSQDLAPAGIAFNDDGTILYMVGHVNLTIFQYTLSTAYDVSTASYASKSFSVSSQDSVPNSFTFNPTGTKLYLTGQTNDNVYQYSLSTAYDISTASYDSVSLSTSSQLNQPRGCVFNNDGTALLVSGNDAVSTNSGVHKYTLTTAYDLSTASYASEKLTLSNEDTDVKNVVFNSSGTKMIFLGGSNDRFYQYTTGSAFTLAWPNNVKWGFGVTPSAPASGNKNIYTFVTTDGGASYYGTLAGSGMA